jgi:hypothetical protein
MAKKKHMIVPEDEWNFKRIRLPVYVANCRQGYLPVPKRRQNHTINEVHHLLNVHSCSDENIPSDMDKVFLSKCFVMTHWDINAEGNVIGLPKKWAYELDWTNSAWFALPCHQVDHDLYWTEVDVWVQREIFRKLQEKQAKNECDEVNGEDISQMLKNGSKFWKDFLEARGTGARASLEYCVRGVVEPVLEATWYIPLSMAPVTPRPRQKRAAGTVKREGLLEILGAIG